MDCQYRRRIENIASGIGPHVTVEAGTDISATVDIVRTALTSALEVMCRLRGPDDIARFALSDIDFDVFRYRLATGDKAGADEQYLRARSQFGAEPRWQSLDELFREASGPHSRCRLTLRRRQRDIRLPITPFGGATSALVDHLGDAGPCQCPALHHRPVTLVEDFLQ